MRRRTEKLHNIGFVVLASITSHFTSTTTTKTGLELKKATTPLSRQCFSPSLTQKLSYSLTPSCVGRSCLLQNFIIFDWLSWSSSCQAQIPLLFLLRVRTLDGQGRILMPTVLLGCHLPRYRCRSRPRPGKRVPSHTIARPTCHFLPFCFVAFIIPRQKVLLTLQPLLRLLKMMMMMVLLLSVLMWRQVLLLPTHGGQVGQTRPYQPHLHCNLFGKTWMTWLRVSLFFPLTWTRTKKKAMNWPTFWPCSKACEIDANHKDKMKIISKPQAASSERSN